MIVVSIRPLSIAFRVRFRLESRSTPCCLSVALSLPKFRTMAAVTPEGPLVVGVDVGGKSLLTPPRVV
jgi:hypothetical protein